MSKSKMSKKRAIEIINLHKAHINGENIDLWADEKFNMSELIVALDMAVEFMRMDTSDTNYLTTSVIAGWIKKNGLEVLKSQ